MSVQDLRRGVDLKITRRQRGKMRLHFFRTERFRRQFPHFRQERFALRLAGADEFGAAAQQRHGARIQVITIQPHDPFDPERP